MKHSSSPTHHASWFAIVPLEWAERMADRCPARAFRVGLALWHLVGRQALAVSTRDLTFYMGGSVSAARRGLADLARAKLLTLTRRPRHRYLVTLPDERMLQAWLEEQTRQGVADSRAPGSPPPGPTQSPTTGRVGRGGRRHNA
jgi:hypothetical protein